MASYDYITATGTVVPDTSTLLADVTAEYQTALGADIVTTTNTPQGMLIAAEVTARQGVIANNALVANQINPNLAGGVFLDAIWALTGGQRIAASNSVVPGVTLTGLPGVVIPAGSQASLADGTLFQSVSGVILDGTGHGTVDFQAVSTGPIACNIGALNLIVTGILGWDTVNNTVATDAAHLGRNQESDQAARLRRRQTLSLQNVALPDAVISALYDTPNVQSLSFRENYGSNPIAVDGITLQGHSIYVCVNGGLDLDVATTLLANKSLGCGWNGGTTVTVTDAASGQPYTVQFDRPTQIGIEVRVTVRNVGALTDPVDAVRNAVLAYANGQLEGEKGFVVNANVSPFEIGGAVGNQVQGLYVKLVELAPLSTGVWQTTEIPILVNQIATLLVGNIIVNIVS